MKKLGTAILMTALVSSSVFAQQTVSSRMPMDIRKSLSQKDLENPKFYTQAFYENLWNDCSSMVSRLSYAQRVAQNMKQSDQIKYEYLARAIDTEFQAMKPRLSKFYYLPHTFVLLQEVNQAAKNITQLSSTSKAMYIDPRNTVAVEYLKNNEATGTLGSQAYIFVNELVNLVAKVQREIDQKHFMPMVRDYCQSYSCGRHDSHYNHSHRFDFKAFDKAYVDIVVEFIKTYEKLSPYAGSFTNQLKMSQQAALSSLSVLDSSLRRHKFICPMNELSDIAQFAHDHYSQSRWAYVDVKTAADWVSSWLKNVKYDVENKNCD